jgi:hypothetical protein
MLLCTTPARRRAIQTNPRIDLFIEESGLTGDQAEEFAASVKDAARQTPRTQLAASRIGRAIKNAPAHVGKLFYEIVKDVLSEVAKKAIWPDRPPT